ncbi:MAG TPA: hypothetical protein VHG91_17040 [Longimicrobium sp.]|nr:hypothetical protein [Longimicrobium sp.]
MKRPVAAALLLLAAALPARADGALLRPEPASSFRPPAAGAADTVPAGGAAPWTLEAGPEALARALPRELPAGDTSTTGTGRAVRLLHTVARGPDAIESGLASPDGAVATARSEWALGSIVRYTVLWSDTGAPVEHVVEREGRQGRALRVRAAGRDTVVETPDQPWAVADVGMEEHLVPILRAPLLGGLQFPFAIFRPRTRSWDFYQATVRNAAGARLVSLADSAGVVTHLLVSDEGDLLVAGRPGGAEERLPLPGSRRRDRVDDYVAMIRGGQDHQSRH